MSIFVFCYVYCFITSGGRAATSCHLPVSTKINNILFITQNMIFLDCNNDRIPTCPPEEKHGMFPRPWWHKPTKGCIEIDSILHDDKITRVIDGVDTILYENLEVSGF